MAQPPGTAVESALSPEERADAFRATASPVPGCPDCQGLACWRHALAAALAPKGVAS